MARKTFVWLSGRKRPPSEYEELSTGIQWSTDPVSRTDLGSWRPESTVLSADWNAFRDPAGMYYRNYVVGQDAVEKQLDAVFALAKDADFISELDADWRDALASLVGAMGYAEWGVVMAMQHVMRFTLSPTVACAVQLQVMDKLRAAERDVEWFGLVAPDGADAAREDAWMNSPALQPLRRYIEECLVEQDWGQVVVAVNLALLGQLQPFLCETYIRGGRAYGDFATASLGTHFAKDATRQVAWTDAFVKFCAGQESNAGPISEWLDRWIPAASDAIDALACAFPLDGVTRAAVTTGRAQLMDRLRTFDVKLTDDVEAALAPDPDSAAA